MPRRAHLFGCRTLVRGSRSPMTTDAIISAAEESDRRYVFHPFTQLDAHEQTGSPAMIVAGSGARVQDIHGRSYIDAMAGLWCVNVGYGRVELGDAMRAHAERLGYYHAFSSMGSDTPGVLADRLIDLAPAGMSKVFFGCTGSDANDTQVKLVWFYNNVLGRPEKKKIIARDRGYHGVSVMSAGLTGLPGLHANFDLPLPMIRHTTAPHRLWQAEPGMTDEQFAQRLADDLEALILSRRARDCGGVHRRAGHGRGRRPRPAGDVLRADPVRPEPVRRPADRRRGHHRVRAARALVRERPLRYAARSDHGGQGAHVRAISRSRAASSPIVSGVSSWRAPPGARSATDTPTPRIRSAPPSP